MTKKVQKGFIMTGSIINCLEEFTISGIVVSKPADTPEAALQKLLDFNHDDNDGVINVKLLKDGTQYIAYGDKIRQL